MIRFTAGGALYEAFAARYSCEKISLRTAGPAAIAADLKPGDVLIHNAANLNPATLDAGVQDNFILTRELVQALIAAEKTEIKFIFISSMSMLGPGAVYKDPLEMNAYSLSKYLAEVYCLKSPIDAYSVRFSTLFYRDPARDGLSKMITGAKSTGAITLLNGGKDTRDFIPLSTAVQYLHKLATQATQAAQAAQSTQAAQAAQATQPGETPNAQGPRGAGTRVFNIGSGQTLSFAELAAMIKKALPATTIGSIDQPGSAPFVLSRFEAKDMDRLGAIDIDLQAEIGGYIKTIS